MSLEGERGRRGAARQGNIISPEPASDSSAVQNMLGFIQDYVPQAVTGPKGEKKERVLWAHFETADINDVSMCHRCGVGGGERCGGLQGDPLPVLLVVGVSSGFSVWTIPAGGDAREVYCSYGDGEVARTVRLLPTPELSRGDRGEDQFASRRPIMAVVKKGRSGSGGVAYSTLQLLSLRAGEGDTLVKKFQFKGQPILGVHSNRRVVAVVLRKRVLVMDAASFGMRFYIKNNYPLLEHITNPVALGQRWLALTETKLSAKHRSTGGVSLHQPPSVATTVIKNVKKGLSALSETLSGLTGKAQQSPDPSDSTPQSADQSTANVVTVLDIDYDHPEEVRLHEAGRKKGGIVAHFIAHSEHGAHIAALTFNPSGTLLVTASTEGHSFHVFHLVPHPWLSGETAVHHLYTLFRGATSASVQDISLSWDSRWVAASTLNGTTHLFPITPYGGEINTRTHTSNRVVNKLSRFHTSAGIETMASQSHSHVTTPSPSSSSSSTSHHAPPHDAPSTAPHLVPWNDPRGIPLPSPITVTALHQIKQPYLPSSESASSSVGASSGAGSAPSPSGDLGDPWPGGPDSQCVRAMFLPTHHNAARAPADSPCVSAVYSLFVVGGSGVVTHHSLQPHPHEDAREGDDAHIALDCHSHLCWRLLSKPHPFTMKLPLAEENPLITANNEYRAYLDNAKTQGSGEGEGSRKKGEGEWLSQVELLTHATPTRRLWMGPQFSFKTYHSQITLPATSPSQSSLSGSGGMVVPTTGDLISLSPDHTHQTLSRSPSAGSAELESAVLSPSHGTLLSDLFQQPAELSTLHTSPIPMPSHPGGSHSREPGMESGPHSMERGVLEVYGSWNKMAPQLEASQTMDVEQRLTEALQDCTLSPPPSSLQPQVTVATRRSGPTNTGFHTPSDHPL